MCSTRFAGSLTLGRPARGLGRQALLLVTICSAAPLAHAQVVADDYVTHDWSEPRWDREAGISCFTLAIRNPSEMSIAGPLWIEFIDVSPASVELITFDGQSTDGNPFVDVSGLLVNARLAPGDAVERQIEFLNPNRARIRPTTRVWSAAVGLYVFARAFPAEGPAPLGVSLFADFEGEISLFEWDFEGDGVFDYASSLSPETIHLYDSVGVYTPTIRVSTPGGESLSDSVLVAALQGLVAEITAHPTEGTRPLIVQFTPGGRSSGPSIDGYRWDWEGDGNYDTGWAPRPETMTHTYYEAGLFPATLQIRDERGNTAPAVQEIMVRNAPPSASVAAVPSNGPAPLEVVFSVTATSPNGAITLVEIDPGDGSEIITLPGPGSASHSYPDSGRFDSWVRVTDEIGEFVLVDMPTIDVYVGAPGAPTAVATATPPSGLAPLDVQFGGGQSWDAGGQIVLYEWDFDFDGITFAAETSSATDPSAQHAFTRSGIHFVALRVTDDEGLTGLDVVAVTVEQTVSLLVLTDTINPYGNGLFSVTPPPPSIDPRTPPRDDLPTLESDPPQQSEPWYATGLLAPTTPPPAVTEATTTTVRTALAAGSEVAVLIRSRAGTHVQTLFSGYRDPGTHEDIWDGRDASGNIVRDGDYYAFVEYLVDGTLLVEPDEPSGGHFGFVSHSENLWNGARFDPWNDEFWQLTFNTTRGNIFASEVTVWITPYQNPYEITTTVHNRDVFGTGYYTTWWDGITDDGSFVPARGQRNASGDDYLWSAQGWALNDNAIVVQGGRAIVGAPEAAPNVWNPISALDVAGSECEVAFTLTHPAQVQLAVYNLLTLRLLRVMRTDVLPVGRHEVRWDGRSESGVFAAPGTYRIQITATASNGNESYRRNVLVMIHY